jgi:hypothetical protein
LHICKTTSLWTFEQAGEEEIKGGANEAGFEVEGYGCYFDMVYRHW